MQRFPRLRSHNLAAQRILVLDGDTGAALSILQSLGRAGYDTWVAGVTLDERAFASRWARGQLLLPDPLRDKVGFQRALLDAQAQHRFALIIPPSERTLTPMHEIRAELGDAARALPPAAAWDVCVDKEAMRELAAGLDVPTPANLMIRGVDDLATSTLDTWLARGPVVCKSIHSKAWRGEVGVAHPVEVVFDRERLDRVVARMLVDAGVQLQQWVPGVGVGIELLCDRGEVVLSFAHERVHELPLTGGGSSYRRSIDMPLAMLEDSRRIMRALEWTGVAMVEFRRHRDEYWMMELNGRFWGSLPLAQFAGVDFPLGLVRLLLDGERPTSVGWRPVYARQLARDLEWFKALTRVRLDDLARVGAPPPERATLLVRPFLESLAELGRILTGVETWDGASLDDPAPILREAGTIVSAEVRRAVRRTAVWLEHRRARRAWQGGARGIKKVLVLCSGNICRSPYAAHRLTEAGFDVRGAAIVGPADRETPPHVQRAAWSRGVDLSSHRSTLVSAEDLVWADLVLIMDMGHVRAMRRWSAVRDKVRWLGALLPDGPTIADPIDYSEEATGRVLDKIDRAVQRLAAIKSGVS